MKKTVSILILIFLISTVPFSVLIAKTSVRLYSRANGNNASIVVDTSSSLGELPRPWETLAQGGEQTTLFDVINEVKEIKIKYVRIDHIYDQYEVVSGSPGSLKYDFSKLDKVIDAIISMGAKPLISLSYMPPVISKSDIIDIPKNWEDWKEVNKKTVEHYSGKDNKAISDIYYEVWNEPDLFGGFKIGGQKDYRLLYLYAAKGASEASGTLPYKIGGPATTAPYRNWMRGLLQFVRQENLRIDFISWHRYHFYTDQFVADNNNVNLWLLDFPNYKNLPRLVTEWGSNSENDPKHDGIFDLAHTIAVSRAIIDGATQAYSFEVKDGPDPKGNKYWGRWGLLTNDKMGIAKKPRFFALKALSNLENNRLAVSGEGTWVTGIASSEGDTTTAILVNYDPYGTHSEITPVTFTNVGSYAYNVIQTIYNSSHPEGKSSESEQKSKGGILSFNISFTPNSAVFIKLKRLSSTINLKPGITGDPSDKAMEVTVGTLLTFPVFETINPKKGTLEFWFKPQWGGTDGATHTFFEMPRTDGKIFGAYKRLAGTSRVLEFGVFEEKENLIPLHTISLNVFSLEENVWHHVAFVWDTTLGDESYLRLFLDGVESPVLFGQYENGLSTNLFVGATKNGSFPIDSDVDEFRTLSEPITGISTQHQQYAILDDPNTIKLLHFNTEKESF